MMKRIKNIMLGLFLVLGCFLLSSIPAKATLHETILVEEKTYSEEIPTPSNPIEGTEYIFAGWFTDESCKSALETKDVGTKAYAKFVPADVMSVKAQVIAGTTYSSTKSDIRFVTTVDSLDYKEAGFEFVIKGRERVSDPITTVYRQLCGIGNTGQVLNYEPKTEFHDASEYFYTWTVYKVPNAYFGEGIKARPYLVTLDGTKVYGEWETKTVNMGYIPAITRSDVELLYNMTAPEGYELQGSCTDGTYFYQAFGSEEATVVYKYDEKGQTSVQSVVLTLTGVSDITYNKTLNQLVVCHGTNQISFLDTTELTVQEETKTLSFDKASGISYNALTGNYALLYSEDSTSKLAIVNSTFENANTYELTSIPNTFAIQDIASDDSYIYFLCRNNSNETYEGHVIAVYDWDGEYVGFIEIPAVDIEKSVEPKNISVVANKMYISCANGALYKVNKLNIKYEAMIGTVYYETLEEAVTVANADTKSDTVEIAVLSDAEFSATQLIKRDTIIRNAYGTDVAITGSDSSKLLFEVDADANGPCSLEIRGTDDGTITIDGEGRDTGTGTSASLIRNEVGCTFTLGANAAIINGAATNGAGALNNHGIAHLYGDFTNNKAGTSGGAIYNQSTGDLTIYGGTYSGNESTGTEVANGGGAIYSAGKLTIAGATFTGNTANSRGGAIYHNTTQQLRVSGSTFNGNSTQTNAGGAMYINQVTSSEDVPSYINETEFYNNAVGKDTDTATTQAGGSCNGGAIAFEKVTLGITDCQFESNTAWRRGGAIFQNGEGTITITSTDKQQGFVNNAADGYINKTYDKRAYGGALVSQGGTIKVNGCILENNKANGKSNGENSTTYEDGGYIIIEGTPEYDARIGKVYYSTLEDAVTAADADTTSETVEITVLNNAVLSTRQAIRRNIVIRNLSGTDVVITGDDPSLQLFRVYNDTGVCSFEISGTNDGSITIDGTGRTTGASLISNDEGCTFTLGNNAAVINGGATSSGGKGAGLNNSGTANLYGDFTGNKAANGGAIYNNSTGVVNIYGGTYSGNESTFEPGTGEYGGGGAIYSAGKLMIAGATFTGNTANSRGGAIYHNTTQQLQVSESTFDGNSTQTNAGGAMYINQVASSNEVPSYINETVFCNNSVGENNSSGYGGAITFEKVTLDIIDCQFEGNTAWRRAGAIYKNGDGTITITSTTGTHEFRDNSVDGYLAASNGKDAADGGALYANKGIIRVTNYIFEGNAASRYGANYYTTSNAGYVYVKDCTGESDNWED